MQEPIITFIVPVKSKMVSASWERFSKLFERALKSIVNQSSDAFRVLVVCHEKPDVTFEHPAVTYLSVDFPHPDLNPDTPDLHRGQKEEDKSKKILAGLAKVKEDPTPYVMVTDADDCISRKIVSTVAKHREENIHGWYFKKGYIYQEGSKLIYLNVANFSMICGSGIIVKPELLEDVFVRRPHLHYAHETKVLSGDKHLKPFPIPGSVYSMTNGENHYMSSAKLKERITSARKNSITRIKGLVKKLKKNRLRFLGRKIRNEFGLYEIS